MKAYFLFLLFTSLSLFSWSAGKKAILSYELPSSLDWRQSTDEGFGNGMQLYTLDTDSNIRLYSIQTGNPSLWEKVSTMDKDALFKELVDGKKVIHKALGYKNWTADKSLIKKSSKEIVFELDGHFVEGKEKKFFVEKYYMTPYGFISITLDWSDKANSGTAKKAKDEFSKIAFKTEIK